MFYEFIDGSEAIARASIKAGCNFFAGYPISPATKILLFMIKELPKINGISIQCEDEIASISMCIAASMAGKKTMTATSGPGMSLFSENIGLAIMGEVPLVIVDVQRLGPATGGATTGAQSDVQFSQWITPGGLPMPILTPSSVEFIFPLTVHAFNVSETLRTPVILLTSKDMAQSKQTVNTKNIKYPEIKNRKYFKGKGEFVPYKFNSPVKIPDFLPIGSKKIVRFTTSMHDEFGFITKNPEKIERKILHLEKKILGNRNLIDSLKPDIEKGSKTLIIAYGINSLTCREVVKKVREKGKKCSLLIIESIFPIPENIIKDALKGVKKVILPEMNTGLYAKSIEPLLAKNQELIKINKVNGELISTDEIISRGNLL